MLLQHLDISFISSGAFTDVQVTHAVCISAIRSCALTAMVPLLLSPEERG